VRIFPVVSFIVRTRAKRLSPLYKGVRKQKQTGGSCLRPDSHVRCQRIGDKLLSPDKGRRKKKNAAHEPIETPVHLYLSGFGAAAVVKAPAQTSPGGTKLAREREAQLPVPVRAVFQRWCESSEYVEQSPPDR